MKDKKIYPISAKLNFTGNTGPEIPVEILVISHKGIMVDSLKIPLTVNRSYSVKFTFPILEEEGLVSAIVFRTYSEIIESPDAQRRVRHISEVLFKAPSKKFSNVLIKFLANVSHRRRA